MFKIMVVVSSVGGVDGGRAIKTDVIEFATIEAANKAAEKLNSSRVALCDITAIRLY